MKNLSADEVLAIPATQPERLFGADSARLTEEYRALMKIWHPDRCADPKAKEVFQRIGELREAALQKIAENTWSEPGFFQCRLKSGQTFRVRADAQHPFELGTMYISPTTVTFQVVGYDDLFESSQTQLNMLKFGAQKMYDAYAASLPTTRTVYEGEGFHLLTVKKRLDDILLRDLLPHIPRPDLPRHVAWITSRLLGMVRYLYWMQINHNAITADTVFVSPSQHTIGLFGGWWYASAFEQKPLALPAASIPYMQKEWRGEVDGSMARDLGLEALGDRHGSGLAIRQMLPPEMLDYLRTPPSNSVQHDLETWYHVLEKSFGPRRFLELGITYGQVYPGGK